MSDYYTPLQDSPPPVEVDVLLPNPINGGKQRLHIQCRHMKIKQFSGLDDMLIGEIQMIADPTGNQAQKIRRLKLKKVLERISNLNPAIYPGGEISDKEELEKWIDSEENDDAVWASWHAYERMIDNPPLKSTDQDSGDRSGTDAERPQETTADPRVPTMHRALPDGEGDRGAVPNRESAGAVS